MCISVSILKSLHFHLLIVVVLLVDLLFPTFLNIFVIGLFCLVLVFIVVMTLFDDSFLLCRLGIFVNGFFGILFGGTCCLVIAFLDTLVFDTKRQDKTCYNTKHTIITQKNREE